MTSPYDVDYEAVAWAEIKADCYAGEECDGIEPHWYYYVEGDRDGTIQADPLLIDVRAFPIGTKITIEEPLCPMCGAVRSTCEVKTFCTFNWNEWTIDKYS